MSTFYAGLSMFAVLQTVTNPQTGKEAKIVRVDPETGREFDVVDWRKSLLRGLTYSIAVMVMLGAHEAGHYLQALRYRVPASLPLFIPMPFSPLGTMGAVIFQQPGVANRKSLFDIAISGPLAGLVVALPLNWWGIQQSQIGKVAPGMQGWTNPLIVEWMVGWIHRPLQAGEDISLNPILFAGWVGIFITALNLIPIGQLDGGHILYCLIGRRAHFVARALFLGAGTFVVIQLFRGRMEYQVWILMLALLWFMGTRHPPTAHDDMPLGLPRIILGWLTLAFILIGFVSTPNYVGPPAKEQKQPIQRSPDTIDVRLDRMIRPRVDDEADAIVVDMLRDERLYWNYQGATDETRIKHG